MFKCYQKFKLVKVIIPTNKLNKKKQKCDALFEETEQQVIRVDLMDKISNKKDQTYYLQKF